jgi:hypothetical protein
MSRSSLSLIWIGFVERERKRKRERKLDGNGACKLMRK